MEIKCGDCVEEMKSIPDNSIDCIITSPPYDGIRKYSEGCSFDILGLGREIERVLVDGSFAVVLIADQKKNKRLSLSTMRLTLDWVDGCGLSLCDWLIYKRQGRIGRFHSFRRDHESILVFFKGENPKPIHTNLLKKKSKYNNIGKLQNVSMRESDDSVSVKQYVIGEDTFCRGSVWEYKGWGNNLIGIKKGVHKHHPAIMRPELARDLLIAFSVKGDKVLDPFMGSGTTGIVSLNNDREFIGIDISQEYCDLAFNRIKQETSQDHFKI